jgi:NitT/TauT family transport system substrate-binding protein
MLDRRRVIRGGLAAAGSFTVAAPFGALAQSKPAAKVRYNEVVRSVLYVPAYIAIAKGYFEEQGIDPTVATAQGGDKCMAAPPTSR